MVPAKVVSKLYIVTVSLDGVSVKQYDLQVTKIKRQ